ncbi:MAG: hypothetical protein ACXW5U_28730 [Thermoanaerobaculia bacterium]
MKDENELSDDLPPNSPFRLHPSSFILFSLLAWPARRPRVPYLSSRVRSR